MYECFPLVIISSEAIRIFLNKNFGEAAPLLLIKFSFAFFEKANMYRYIENNMHIHVYKKINHFSYFKML